MAEVIGQPVSYGMKILQMKKPVKVKQHTNVEEIKTIENPSAEDGNREGEAIFLKMTNLLMPKN